MSRFGWRARSRANASITTSHRFSIAKRPTPTRIDGVVVARVVRGEREQLAARLVAPRVGAEHVALDPERHPHDARDAVRDELRDLPLGGDERGVAPAGDRSHEAPERPCRLRPRADGARPGRRPEHRYVTREPCLENPGVGVDEVRMPLERPDPVGPAFGPHRPEGGQVGGVDLEDVRPLPGDDLRDFVESEQQMVRRIIRRRGAPDPDHACACF